MNLLETVSKLRLTDTHSFLKTLVVGNHSFPALFEFSFLVCIGDASDLAIVALQLGLLHRKISDDYSHSESHNKQNYCDNPFSRSFCFAIGFHA